MMDKIEFFEALIELVQKGGANGIGNVYMAQKLSQMAGYLSHPHELTKINTTRELLEETLDD